MLTTFTFFCPNLFGLVHVLSDINYTKTATTTHPARMRLSYPAYIPMLLSSSKGGKKLSLRTFAICAPKRHLHLEQKKTPLVCSIFILYSVHNNSSRSINVGTQYKAGCFLCCFLGRTLCSKKGKNVHFVKIILEFPIIFRVFFLR